MRVEIEQIIEELNYRKGREKGLRNRLLLDNTLSNLLEYKKATEKPL